MQHQMLHDGGNGTFIVGTPNDVTKPLVGLAIPAGTVMLSPTAFALHLLGCYTQTAQILPIIMMGQDPAQARNQMAAAFMEQKIDGRQVEAMLFVDSDMLFPPSTLDRLFAHDLDIVAADYRQRAHPFGKIGWPLEGLTDPPGGLVERVALGLGVMMIRRRVFETVPRPWFARIYSGETQANAGVMTEDYYLCLKAREHGFKVWCDLDITKEVMHIGEQPVPWVIPQMQEQEQPKAPVEAQQAQAAA